MSSGSMIDEMAPMKTIMDLAVPFIFPSFFPGHDALLGKVNKLRICPIDTGHPLNSTTTRVTTGHYPKQLIHLLSQGVISAIILQTLNSTDISITDSNSPSRLKKKTSLGGTFCLSDHFEIPLQPPADFQSRTYLGLAQLNPRSFAPLQTSWREPAYATRHRKKRQ